MALPSWIIFTIFLWRNSVIQGSHFISELHEHLHLFLDPTYLKPSVISSKKLQEQAKACLITTSPQKLSDNTECSSEGLTPPTWDPEVCKSSLENPYENQQQSPKSWKWPKWKQTCRYNSTQLLQQLEATAASKCQRWSTELYHKKVFIVALILKLQNHILQSQISSKLFWFSTSHVSDKKGGKSCK